MLRRHSPPRHVDRPGDKIRAVAAKPTDAHQRVRPEAVSHPFPAGEIAALPLAENQLGYGAHVSAFDYDRWQISDGVLREATTIAGEGERVEACRARGAILQERRNGERIVPYWQSSWYVLRSANRLQNRALARFLRNQGEYAAELKVEKRGEAA